MAFLPAPPLKYQTAPEFQREMFCGLGPFRYRGAGEPPVLSVSPPFRAAGAPETEWQPQISFLRSLNFTKWDKIASDSWIFSGRDVG
jgi:hypothetical protein